MKQRHELTEIMQLIGRADSPVGMDAVYVHALILDKLTSIEQRLARLESESAIAQHAHHGPTKGTPN